MVQLMFLFHHKKTLEKKESRPTLNLMYAWQVEKKDENT